ncbi:MAG: type II toxin-antitoxin system RelE/ParE family toxin [Actinomycetes bacterium]
MSRYDVAWTSTALRHFDSLPKKVAVAIIEFCESTLCDQPIRASKQLNAPFDRMRSVRRGQYRVIISIDEEHSRVFVHAIRHRNVAYAKK